MIKPQASQLLLQQQQAQRGLLLQGQGRLLQALVARPRPCPPCTWVRSAAPANWCHPRGCCRHPPPAPR